MLIMCCSRSFVSLNSIATSIGHFRWCVESNKCQAVVCKTSIKVGTQYFLNNNFVQDALNCPTAPQSGYEYTDDFGRNVAMPIVVAAGIHDPATCLK